MKSNSALLTTAARAAAQRTILDYQAGVYDHVGGGWEKHTQARMYEVPYEVTSSTTQAAGVKVTVYQNWKDTGLDVEMSNPYPNGSFIWPAVNFATKYGYQWHPYGLKNFAAMIEGSVLVATTGDYTFTLDSDDGSYFFVDGVLKINNGGDHSPRVKTEKINLTAGVHSIRVAFFEAFGNPSGVDLTVPPGIVYGDIVTTKKVLASHTLRMLMDYSNAGTPTTGTFKVPANRTTNTYGPTAAPIIVTEPLSYTVKLGTTVTFTVVAISSLQVSYQWFYNGVPIKNAVNSSYTVDVATYDTAGEYTVTITNAVGTSTSTPANLIIQS